MASKKLRPGSFKSGAGGRKTSTRRTGRTAGTSQSAFAGYGFQGQHPATQAPTASPDEAADEQPESTVESTDESVHDATCNAAKESVDSPKDRDAAD